MSLSSDISSRDVLEIRLAVLIEASGRSLINARDCQRRRGKVARKKERFDLTKESGTFIRTVCEFLFSKIKIESGALMGECFRAKC